MADLPTPKEKERSHHHRHRRTGSRAGAEQSVAKEKEKEKADQNSDKEVSPTTHVKTIGSYQLGDSIGKGGFGVVYKALNIETGEVVAIKQIKLHNIPKDQLQSIMMEIDLLKKLKHPNIVKYIGYTKTKEYLNIIMEYVENGSLLSIVKKFGKFPESLCVVYISQVLVGLCYLHEQGVIHRDIKGANILTTKSGHVKLADFGVATQLSDNDKNSVVGSPYWMAPEIIEMSGASTKSDIWSVGCTVIELLTGAPPYYDLGPMPAMFRIVQDDCPPLPDGISAPLRDFLMQCFQKEPSLRISAQKLLKHRWIQAYRKKLGKAGRPVDSPSRPVPSDESVDEGDTTPTALPTTPSRPSASRDTAIAGRHSNGAVSTSHSTATALSSSPLSTSPAAAAARPASPRSRYGTLESAAPKMEDVTRDILDYNEKLQRRSVLARLGSQAAGGVEQMRATAAAAVAVSTSPQKPKKTEQKPKKEPKVENWDEEFDIDRASVATPKPLAALAPKTAPPPTTKPPSEVENWDSDFVDDDDEKTATMLRIKIEDLPKKATPPSPAKSTTTPTATVPAPPVAMATAAAVVDPLRKYQEKADDLFDDFDDVIPSEKLSGKPKVTAAAPSTPGDKPAAKTASPTSTPSTLLAGGESDKLDKYRESAEAQDDWSDDIEGDVVAKATVAKTTARGGGAIDFTAKLRERLSGNSGSGISATRESTPVFLTAAVAVATGGFDEDDDEDDLDAVFESDEDDDVDVDLDQNAWKDNFASMSAEVVKLMGLLSPDQKEDVIRSTCDALIAIFNTHTELKRQLLRTRGVIPIMEMLEVPFGNSAVVVSILQVVNAVIAGQVELQENLCLVGGIPAIAKFAGAAYPLAVRLEAARFVTQMCRASTLTLQMFIACRGLTVLAELLAACQQYREQKDLVFMAIDAISSVFDLQSHTPKNDFCRLFAKAALLRHLAVTLAALAVDAAMNETARGHLRRVVDIFLIFSQADAVVKAQLCQSDVLTRLLDALDAPAVSSVQELKVKLLKSIKHLSADANSLVPLQRAGAIPKLVGLLGVRTGPAVSDMHAQLVNALFNLCRIDKERQEAAAVAGIVPHLMYVIRSENPLKQFALQILCEMAHARGTRAELWKNQGVEFYIYLLRTEKNWQAIALDALSVWLVDDKRVEPILAKSENVDEIAGLFIVTAATIPPRGRGSAVSALAKLLDPFLRIVSASAEINRKLSQNKDFMYKLLEKLVEVPSAQVRVPLLKLLSLLFECHLNPAKMVADYNLKLIVQRLVESDTAVLVQEIGSKLLQAFKDRQV